MLPRLKGGSWISLTLTWDRVVNLVEAQATTNGRYDIGETFVARPAADLDLYLMPAGATTTDQKIRASVTTTNNVEHIFFQLPAGDAAYEIWVDQYSNVGAKYALAWWTEAAPQPRRLGDWIWLDRNGNGLQEAAEPGLAGVPVQLYTSTDSLVASTVTDQYGRYVFESVAPGNYYLTVSNPSGYTFSPKDVGADDAADSDADVTGKTSVFTVSSAYDLTRDVGLERFQL